MGFNYAKEKQKFEKHWKVIRQQYESAGMSQDAIEELHDFDWDWFKSRRRYINHLADLPDSVSVEDFPQKGVEMSTGDTPVRYGSVCVASKERYHWIDEIEDERLFCKLMLLSTDDLELLTSLAFEGYTQSEIAQRKAVSQATISRQLSQIKKLLRKNA